MNKIDWGVLVKAVVAVIGMALCGVGAILIFSWMVSDHPWVLGVLLVVVVMVGFIVMTYQDMMRSKRRREHVPDSSEVEESYRSLTEGNYHGSTAQGIEAPQEGRHRLSG